VASQGGRGALLEDPHVDLVLKDYRWHRDLVEGGFHKALTQNYTNSLYSTIASRLRCPIPLADALILSVEYSTKGGGRRGYGRRRRPYNHLAFPYPRTHFQSHVSLAPD